MPSIILTFCLSLTGPLIQRILFNDKHEVSHICSYHSATPGAEQWRSTEISPYNDSDSVKSSQFVPIPFKANWFESSPITDKLPI
jgi:hypothetical protein